MLVDTTDLMSCLTTTKTSVLEKLRFAQLVQYQPVMENEGNDNIWYTVQNFPQCCYWHREPYILHFVTKIFVNNKMFRPRLRFSFLGLGEIIQSRVAWLIPEHLYTREVCVRFAEKNKWIWKIQSFSARSNSLAFVIPLMLHGNSCAIKGIIIDLLVVVISRGMLHPKNVKNHI